MEETQYFHVAIPIPFWRCDQSEIGRVKRAWCGVLTTGTATAAAAAAERRVEDSHLALLSRER